MNKEIMMNLATKIRRNKPFIPSELSDNEVILLFE